MAIHDNLAQNNLYLVIEYTEKFSITYTLSLSNIYSTSQMALTPSCPSPSRHQPRIETDIQKLIHNIDYYTCFLTYKG